MSLCPKCGGADLAMTCMGLIGGIDRNHARCPCGWKGRAFELVNAPAGLPVRPRDEFDARLFEALCGAAEADRQAADARWAEECRTRYGATPRPAPCGLLYAKVIAR